MATEKGGRKRTKNERERDLAIISELYVKGIPAAEITRVISEQYENFDLSERTIEYDKAELRTRWIKSQLVNFDEAKARELELIDRCIEACWVGWENSLEDSETEIINEGEEDKLAGGESTEPTPMKYYRKQLKRAARDGNSVWIDELRKLSDQRAKILGLYEAEKFQISVKERLEQAGMPTEAIESTLAEAERIAAEAFSTTE